MTADRPLPVLDDAGSDVFWRHLRDHELVYQRCRDCAETVFYPRGHCTACGSAALDVHRSAGTGTVYSATVVHAHPDPYFRARIPYVVAIVELDEGFRMLSEVLAGPAGVAIGDRVRLTWDSGQDLPIPVFARADA